MNKLISWLDGKKTIISALAGAIWTVLFQQKFIDQNTFETGGAIAAFLGILFMRLAINKNKYFVGSTTDITHPGPAIADVKTIIENSTITTTEAKSNV